MGAEKEHVKKIASLDAVLPQTQCGDCGYPACQPYAEAVAAGSAPIDRCAPGGRVVLQKIAQILAMDPSPYLDSVMQNHRQPSIFRIKPEECIGCTKCIKACPVDAIVGAPKHMHVIVADLCTGCGLCVTPCPVDCIDEVPLDAVTLAQQLNKSERWRSQYQAHQQRLQQDEAMKMAQYQSIKADVVGDVHA